MSTVSRSFLPGMFPAYLHINNLVVKKVPARAAGIEEAGEEGGKPYLLPGTQLWEQGVAGSNPVAPTIGNQEVIPCWGYDLFCVLRPNCDQRKFLLFFKDKQLPKQAYAVHGLAYAASTLHIILKTLFLLWGMSMDSDI